MKYLSARRYCLPIVLLLAACGNRTPDPTPAAPPPPAPVASASSAAAATPGALPVVFVITMENHDSAQIYGNSVDAPYLNDTLMKRYAYATDFVDALPQELPSESHYVLMEAGTHAFADATFTTNSDPSAANSTASTAHLVTQIRNAGVPGLDWMSYQEGINAATGACPVHSDGFYATKHNPYVFFHDVAGNPPSPTQPYCAAHHRDLGRLAADLAAGSVAAYNFISPNQCNDMHGASGCPDGNGIRAGDNWLRTTLPHLIDYVNRHRGVILLVWDEGDRTAKMPFLAIGPGVKPGYASSVRINHASVLRSVEAMLRLAPLPTVSAGNDLSDLFLPGAYP
jgi:hypothetical protein